MQRAGLHRPQPERACARPPRQHHSRPLSAVGLPSSWYSWARAAPVPPGPTYSLLGSPLLRGRAHLTRRWLCNRTRASHDTNQARPPRNQLLLDHRHSPTQSPELASHDSPPFASTCTRRHQPVRLTTSRPSPLPAAPDVACPRLTSPLLSFARTNTHTAVPVASPVAYPLAPAP